MIKLDTPIFKALLLMAAVLPLSCSGEAGLEEDKNKQGIAEDGSDGNGDATNGDDGEGPTGGTDDSSASNGSGATGSGDTATSGSATSGVGGASDGTSATSNGESAGGTGGDSGTGGISGTGGAPTGGSGGSGEPDTSTTGGDATGGGGAPECEQVQCFRAIDCVETCEGPVVKSGCCPCDEGTFDRIECTSTTLGSGCVDGEMKDDGCNTCTCANGGWACTKRACPEEKACGGWAGNTCSKTEYCAYVAGQLCGAADASATCKPRPEACTQEYDPVCGCDGKTYGNDCSAAAAGTGVLSEGPCSSG